MKKREEEQIAEYQREYTDWEKVLRQYFTRFDTNYKQYTAYSTTIGTRSKISDPVAPELVERVIQKLFERDPKFYVLARGYNIPKEVNKIIASTIEYYWTAPESVQSSGTTRSKLKVIGREFCVTGNVATETFFDNNSDCPSFRVIPIEDIVFDPTKTLKTSPKYYLVQNVSLDYLKENIFDKKSNRGLFKNIDKLEEDLKDEKRKKDADEMTVNRSGSDTYEKKQDLIKLISVWEGKKLVQIADWKYIVREIEDPMQIDDDPLDFAMDIEVPKQPYAFSMLDFLNGLTKAKDMFLNQLIDYGSKVLNPPLFVDPSLAPVNRATLKNAWRIGGLVFADPKSVEHKTMPNLGNQGFDMLSYIQQRSESVSGIGAYLGGVPNQTSDKTQGTKGGIEALIGQASSPVRDRQLNLEESIIEPIINKWVKMAGHLMASNEKKYVLLTGEDQKWVKVTKGLLTGKVKIMDLMEADAITDEEVQEIVDYLMMMGKDPNQEVIFDVDWLARVEAGSLAEVDTEKDLRDFDSWVQFCMGMGVPLDAEKVAKERALRSGIKEPEQYIQSQPAMPQMPQAPQEPMQEQMPQQPQMQPQMM